MESTPCHAHAPNGSYLQWYVLQEMQKWEKFKANKKPLETKESMEAQEAFD